MNDLQALTASAVRAAFTSLPRIQLPCHASQNAPLNRQPISNFTHKFRGTAETNLYYDYYATQVLRHWDGELWERWDAAMRKQLLGVQCTAGHEQGSWCIAGDHGATKGGRLYTTALATMILEVYYRISPIYRQESVEDTFPL